MLFSAVISNSAFVSTFFFAIMNNAARDICVQVFCGHMFSIPLGKIPMSGIAGSYGLLF